MKITLERIIAAMMLAFSITYAVAVIGNQTIVNIYLVAVFSFAGSMMLSAWYFNRVSRANPWVIKKGQSWANHFYWFPFYNKTEFEFSISIYQDSLLTEEDIKCFPKKKQAELTTQINKLCGPSFNGWFGGNDKNSIRAGWCDDKMKGQPDLFNYTYSDGKRVVDELVGREPWIGQIQASKDFKVVVKLIREENLAMISVYIPSLASAVFNSVVPVDASKFSKWGRISLPEFDDAPKDMKFKAQLTSMK